MQLYLIIWSVVMFFCVITQISILSEIRDYYKVIYGAWMSEIREVKDDSSEY